MEWLTWAAKAAGAGVVGLVGISLLTAAFMVKDAGVVVAGLGIAACAGAWFGWPRMPNAWRRDPPTQKQLRYAADLGIRVPRGATKGDVSDAISRVTGR